MVWNHFDLSARNEMEMQYVNKCVYLLPACISNEWMDG